MKSVNFKNMSIDYKIEQIIKILKKEYPDSKTALHFNTPHQMLVATILSAQCTDKRVNLVTKKLFIKYKNVEDFANADLKNLEKEIYSTGFYKNKAKNIKEASKKIISDYNSKVPDNIKDLIKLPGVARKTANVVLSSVFKKSEGIVVDTHVKRVSKRLGLTNNTDPVKIEQDLMKIVPEKHRIDISYLLISHGRSVCKSRKPLCKDCCLNKICFAAFI